MPLWLQLSIGMLTFLTLLGATWRQVVRPLVRLAGTAERAAPALEKIAADFPVVEGRSQLTVRINQMEQHLQDGCKELIEDHVRTHHHG